MILWTFVRREILPLYVQFTARNGTKCSRNYKVWYEDSYEATTHHACSCVTQTTNQQNITLAKKTLKNNLLACRNEWWPSRNVGGIKLWRISENNEK